MRAISRTSNFNVKNLKYPCYEDTENTEQQMENQADIFEDIRDSLAKNLHSTFQDSFSKKKTQQESKSLMG